MLEALIRMRANVVGVCTLADAPFNTDHVDLTEMAKGAGIAVCYTPDINSAESIDWIQKRSPDVVFCFGWSRLIKQPLLSLAPFGVIGYHPAALPANRGRHPLIWALALGLEQTASTFFFMDEGADSGDIFSQKELTIEETDDTASLYERMAKVAIAQLKEFMPALENDRYTRTPQIGTQTNYWRKRRRTDGLIDWRMSARSIYNLVRALCHPYPGAHFMHKGKEIKVWATEIVPDARKNLEPGKVLAVAEGGVIVKAGADAVHLLSIDPMPILTVGDYL